MNALVETILVNSFKSSSTQLTGCRSIASTLLRWYISREDKDKVLLILDCEIDKVPWYMLVSRSNKTLHTSGKEVYRLGLIENNYAPLSFDYCARIIPGLFSDVLKEMWFQRGIENRLKPYCRKPELKTYNICEYKLENQLQYYRFFVSCIKFFEQKFPSHKSRIEVVLDKKRFRINHGMPTLATMGELTSNADYVRDHEERLKKEKEEEEAEEEKEEEEEKDEEEKEDEDSDDDDNDDGEETGDGEKKRHRTKRGRKRPLKEWGTYYNLPSELDKMKLFLKTIFDNELAKYTGCNSEYLEVTRWYKSYKNVNRLLLGYVCDKDGQKYDHYFSAYKEEILQMGPDLSQFDNIEVKQYGPEIAGNSNYSLVLMDVIKDQILLETSQESKDWVCLEPAMETRIVYHEKVENELSYRRFPISCKNKKSWQFPSHLLYIEVMSDYKYKLINRGHPTVVNFEKPLSNVEYIWQKQHEKDQREAQQRAEQEAQQRAQQEAQQRAVQEAQQRAQQEAAMKTTNKVPLVEIA